MRVNISKIEFIKQSIKAYVPDAEIYLIGSRINDNLKGGDIDILVIGKTELSGQEKRNVKIAFYKKFGEQKLDIVSFTHDESSNFKELALLESIAL